MWCETHALHENIADSRDDSVFVLALGEGGFEFLVNEDEFFEVGEEEAEEVGGDGMFDHVCVVHSKHDLQVTHVVALRVKQLYNNNNTCCTMIGYGDSYCKLIGWCHSPLMTSCRFLSLGLSFLKRSLGMAWSRGGSSASMSKSGSFTGSCSDVITASFKSASCDWLGLSIPLQRERTSSHT